MDGILFLWLIPMDNWPPIKQNGQDTHHFTSWVFPYPTHWVMVNHLPVFSYLFLLYPSSSLLQKKKNLCLLNLTNPHSPIQLFCKHQPQSKSIIKIQDYKGLWTESKRRCHQKGASTRWVRRRRETTMSSSSSTSELSLNSWKSTSKSSQSEDFEPERPFAVTCRRVGRMRSGQRKSAEWNRKW